MKSLIASIIIAIAVTVSTVVSGIYVNTSLNNISEALDDELDSSKSYEQIIKTAQNGLSLLEKEKLYLSLFLRDSMIRSIESYLYDIESAAMAGSNADILTAKSRLLSEIDEVRRLCSFGTEAIF